MKKNRHRSPTVSQKDAGTTGWGTISGEDSIQLSSVYSSPWRLFVIMIAGIFIAEVIAMLVVYTLGPIPYYRTTLISTGIIMVLTFPVLYFLSFRPLLDYVNQRQQVEYAFRQKEELQQRFFDSIDPLIAYMDRDFNFIKANAAYARASGHLPEYLTGKNHFALYPHAENEEIFRRVVETGEAYFVCKKPFVYPDQPERGVTYWNWSLRPVKDMAGSVEGLVLSLVDVTEQKRAEEEIISLSKFPTENPNPILRMQNDGRITYANAASEDLLQLWGCRVEDDIPADLKALVAEAVKPGSDKTIEVSCNEKVISIMIVPIVESGYINLYGRDITAHKQAEIALQESEQRLNRAQEIAHLGSWELELVNNRLTWSDEVYRIFGLQPQEFGATYKAFLEAVHPDDRAAVDAAYSGSIREGRDAYEIEHRIIRRSSGEIRIVHEKCEHFRNEDGQITHSVGMVHDITERKQAEEALRESEERYRSLFNSMSEGFALHEIICDEAGIPCNYRFLEINPSFERLTGLGREVTIGRTVKEVLPGIEAFWIEMYGQVALTGQPVHFDNYAATLDRHYDVYAYRPALGQFAVVFMDVTERRKAEMAVQQRNEELEVARAVAENEKRRLEAVMEALPVGVAITDKWGGTVQSNLAFEQIWGRPRPDVHSVSDYAAFHAWWADTGKAVLPDEWASAQVMQKGIPVIGQLMEIQRFDGAHAFIINSAAPIRDASGTIVGSAVALQDVTDLHQAEQALRAARDELELRVQERTKELADANLELLHEINERKEIERQLRVETTALESAANGVIITGRHGNIRWANPAFLSMTGYSLDEVLGQNPRLLHSGEQDASFYQHLWSTILAGKVWRGEVVNRRKDGSLYVEEQTITPLANESGEISNFIAIKQDVTERKQAEAELERRNLELEAISALEHKQRQIAETLRSSAQALAQTLDLDTVLRTLLKHVRPLVQSDTASVILLEGESLLAVRAVEGYEKWTDPDQVLSLKLDGENNPFYQKLLSTRRSLLIPDTAEEPDWEVYPGTEAIRNCILAPIVAEEKIIGVVGLGKTEANYFTEEHVKWAEALVGQAAVAIQNAWLFEQVRAGRERLQSLSRRLVEVQETERRFISRELHDHAGQTLTCLILGLGALEREASEPQKVRTHTAELKEITHSVLKDLHRLAISLRPASLDQLGLVPALEQLIQSFAQNSRMQIRFKAVGICEDDRLTHEIETTLYRIAQEALTNVIRHAGAQRADVVLERRGDMVLILVEDDGKGFDVEGAKMGGPLGLLGMQERAEMLGGTLTVESTEGRGTTLVVEVPYVNTNYARG